MTSPPDPVPARTVLGHDPRAIAVVFLGGALGGLLRALLADLIPTHPGHWPWATWTVNVIGTAALAAVLVMAHERRPYRRLLLGTGLCGGLTTFSTMQVELVAMLQRGEIVLAAGYLTSAIAAGLVAADAVTRLVHRWQEKRA